MITVMELVAHPVFKEFKLLAGESVLYNPVLGTAIFEWESADDVERTFSEGEFVVTTLSQAKNDVSLAEKCIKLLIKKGVCAIGIKTVYFKEISEDLKLYSDEHKVPIFFFLDTFFDDIIFTIKDALISNYRHNEKVGIRSIETSFRDLKHTIGTVNFHYKKVEYIEQEIWVRLILFNFSMAMKICHHFIRLQEGETPLLPF